MMISETRRYMYVLMFFLSSSVVVLFGVTTYRNQDYYFKSSSSSSRTGSNSTTTSAKTRTTAAAATRTAAAAVSEDEINTSSRKSHDHATCRRYNESSLILDTSTTFQSLGGCARFRLRSQEEERVMQDAIDQIQDWSYIEKFVMFFAFPRSGHSWMGAILDAAPNALIANEWNVVGHYRAQTDMLAKTFRRGEEQPTQDDERLTTRGLYNELAKNSYICGLYGRIQVYDYTIQGLWQGQLLGGPPKHKIQVIGDKKGGWATRFLSHGMDWKKNRTAWNDNEIAKHVHERFNSLMDTVTGRTKEDEEVGVDDDPNDRKNMPSKTIEPRLIVVFRNPYDMIATEMIRDGRHKSKTHIRKQAVKRLLENYQVLLWAIENLGKPSFWHVVTTENFNRDTEHELQKLCDFTTVDCPNILREKVLDQTRHSTHKTRYQVPWTTEIIQMVQTFILQSGLSKYYSPCFYDDEIETETTRTSTTTTNPN